MLIHFETVSSKDVHLLHSDNCTHRPLIEFFDKVEITKISIWLSLVLMAFIPCLLRNNNILYSNKQVVLILFYMSGKLSVIAYFGY